MLRDDDAGPIGKDGEARYTLMEKAGLGVKEVYNAKKAVRRMIVRSSRELRLLLYHASV